MKSRTSRIGSLLLVMVVSGAVVVASIEFSGAVASDRAPVVDGNKKSISSDRASEGARVRAATDDFDDRTKVLTFSGRGKLSLLQGDLIFLPEGKDAARVLGLPVSFDKKGRPSGFDGADPTSEIYGIVGGFDFRYDVNREELHVVGRGDEGEMIDRVFDLFLARPEDGTQIGEVVGAYFSYIATGLDPSNAVGVQEGGAVAAALLTNSCQCSTLSCSSTQDCRDNQTCKCACKGQECQCWCSSAM